VIYLIQIPKAIRLNVLKMPGAFKPPAPQAPVPVRYVCVRTRPQRGLAGVFAFGAPEVQTETYRAKRLDLPD